MRKANTSALALLEGALRRSKMWQAERGVDDRPCGRSAIPLPCDFASIPTDRRYPLHGVEFWLKQLKVGQPSRRSESGNSRDTCRIVLVAAASRCARSDRALDAYCHRRGIPP